MEGLLAAAALFGARWCTYGAGAGDRTALQERRPPIITKATTALPKQRRQQ